MTYALDTSACTKERIVLKRSRRINHAMLALSVAIGLPLTLAGFFVLLFAEGQSIAFMLAGIGICLMALGQLINNQFRAPRRLIFDNSRGYLLVDEARSKETHAATVPYGAIENFRWSPHTALSGAGHASGTGVVEMTKRNGAVWTLSVLPTLAQAQELVETLRRGVDLESPVDRPSHLQAPRLIRVNETEEGAVVKWRRRYSIVQSALLFVAMMGLTVTVVGAQSLVSTALYYGGLGVCGVLASLALFTTLSAALNTRRIELTADTLRANCGIKRANIQVPLSQIDAVVFNFAPSQRDALFILNKAEREQLMELTRGKVSLANAFAASALSGSIARIEVGDLTMPEKLNLEVLVQRLIIQATRRVVH